MRFLLSAFSIVALISVAFDAKAYQHRWVFDGQHVGVEIINTSGQKISCNVQVRVTSCFANQCRTSTKGGATGIIQPGQRRVTGWFLGSGSSYNTNCSAVR
jgi:hypothetical protein